VQGPQGVQGAQGARGPTGAAPLTAVGSFFSTSPGASVAAAGNAPLTTVGGGNTTGAFTLASNTVTIVNPGTYLLGFRAAITANTSAIFSLFVNGGQVAGTNGISTSSAVNAGSHELTGSAAVTVTANSTVQIRNVTAAAVVLAGAVNAVNPTTVTLTLVKVG